MIQLTSLSRTASVANHRLARQAKPIATVLPDFNCAGAQRDMILLFNALAEKGIATAVFVLRDEGPLRSLIDPKIPIIQVPGRRIRYAIPGLRKTIRSLRPRIVLSSGANLNLCCLLAVRSLGRRIRPKLVLREVNTPSMAKKLDPRWQDRIAYRVLRRGYRTADRVITLTEGARQELIQQFSVDAKTVIAMRSNAVITRETVDRIAAWDGEQGRDANLIVSIGRLSPEKNHKLLLRALALIDRRRPWHLALVGEGTERTALQNFAHENGISQRITFAGYAADPFAWLMRAGVAVCSSIYEGLCNAIIEALGCGTPVVSTDCPYGPREILQGGRYGTLVPAGDAAALASGIECALDLVVDRARLIARANDYTAERAADTFLEIVSEL
jgi:glycosyltransferase involved in cell wall biosynthesis